MQPFPYQITPSSEDERFMLEALKEAWKAYQQHEVPIGAVLVQDGRIIARGSNQVEMLKDATAHAEMICLTAGSAALENWRLMNAALYCTLEPCAMCAGAMFLSRLKTLVFGAFDLRHGACGSWVNLFACEHPIHTIDVRSCVLSDPCGEILTRFFQEQRQKKGGLNGKSPI